MESRYHLPVLSECDSECKLCGALGCLRPHRLTFPEFLKELDRATFACAKTIVFPPNFLNHPEAAQFCFEASRRGLTPLVRLRPSQLASHSELLSTLEYRNARFEVVVTEAIPEVALESSLDFKCVLIPSSLVDANLLYDSLPFAWRRGLEVLTPFSSSFEFALTPDDVFLFVANRRLRPYQELFRETIGSMPGVRETLLYKSGHDQKIETSVVVAVRNESEITKTIKGLDDQSIAREKFEIIIACDRVSDEFLESVNAKSNVQILKLAECWGEPGFRQAQAFNIAARYARGSRLLFLSENFPVERELLKRCAERSEPFLKIDSRRSDQPTLCAHLISLREFFALGGFIETEQTGFEFLQLECKAAPTLWVLGDTDKADVQALAPKVTPLRRKAAQDFYLTTLDHDFYRQNFALMGPQPFARKLYSWLALLKPVRNAIARAKLKFEIARAARHVVHS